MLLPLLLLALPASAFQPAAEPDKLIALYQHDRGSLMRYYDIDSPARRKRMEQFTREWLTQLEKVRFDNLNVGARIDYVVFHNYLEHELKQLELQSQWAAETEPILPFAQAILGLEDARRKIETMNARDTAAKITRLAAEVEKARKDSAALIKEKKIAAARASRILASLRNTLKTWYGFYDGYDPMFSWWVAQPYKALDKAIEIQDLYLLEKTGGKSGDYRRAAVS